MEEGPDTPIVLIPDEYSDDPATAFELGRRWGIDRFEIRYAYRWRVPLSPAWAADRVAAAVRDYGVTVTGISPGLFKPTMRADGAMVPISTDTPAEIRRHLEEVLPAALAFAARLGTRNVTVFALPRPTGGPEPRKMAAESDRPAVVVDALKEAAGKAAGEGFQLLLENGGGTWADSARASRSVLEAVGSEALRLTWDPANVAHAMLPEDPVGEGYPLVSDFVANVHVKDVTITDDGPAWAMIGEGVVDWPGQLRGLRRDGYRGPLTVEPHFQYQPGANTNLLRRVESFLARLREIVRDSRTG